MVCGYTEVIEQLELVLGAWEITDIYQVKAAGQQDKWKQ